MEVSWFLCEFLNDRELIIKSPIYFHIRIACLISKQYLVFAFLCTGRFSRWLFVRSTPRTVINHPCGAVERITYSLSGTTERSSGYATGCAYARLYCHRSHLHAEDAPTRFQSHSPGRCRCIQGLYCLLICSPFKLASVSMEIVVPFGTTKCRSESRRTERTYVAPFIEEITCKKRQWVS